MQTYRTEGLLPPELNQKTIVILGLGSAGAAFAFEIAYEFKKLILIDKGVLRIDNIERHPLGMSYLGVNKAKAVADSLIKEKGVPANTILAFAGTDEEILPQCLDADLVVCAIDDKPSCRRINAWCVENNIPAIYVGIYPMGRGGEVIAIPTPKDVCYLCAEHSRADKVLPPAYEGNYGVNPELLGDPDSPKAIAALKASVTAIVSEMVPLAWRILFPGDDPVTVQIRFRALEGWIEVARIHKSSPELGIEIAEIAKRKNLLLAENNAKIAPADSEGYYGFLIRRQPWPKAVVQWPRCPMHGQGVQLSDL